MVLNKDKTELDAKKYMGFAEWVEGTSGYRREEAETKAERQK